MLILHTSNGRYKLLHNCRHHIFYLVHLEEMGGTFLSVNPLVPQLVLTSGKAVLGPSVYVFLFFVFLVEEVSYWTSLCGGWVSI